MNRSLIWPILLVAASGLMLFLSSPASAARSHQDVPPLPGATPFVIGIPTATPIPPPPHSTAMESLSGLQQQQVIAIALKSQYVKRLLRGTSYRVSGVTPWLDHKKKLVGGVAHLDFARHVTIAGTWLGTSGKPYKATYRNVSGLTVYVSLKRGNVTAILPR